MKICSQCGQEIAHIWAINDWLPSVDTQIALVFKIGNLRRIKMMKEKEDESLKVDISQLDEMIKQLESHMVNK